MGEADYSRFTSNHRIIAWVRKVRDLCQPKDVMFCDGTREEYDRLCQGLVDCGTFVRLNGKLRPNSFLARSDPRDVARVEKCTYICTKKQEDAGATNNWEDPDVMKRKLDGLFKGCMEGRTMYIVPFCMGPISSPISKVGIQITDSAYVVVNMYIMARMGKKVLDKLGKELDFLPCLHSVGYPLCNGRQDVPWPCDPQNKYICHFPEQPAVLSYGSGYGGNALLGKKCFALRIASYMGRQEGWLAEHCLIIGCKSPEGKKHYIAAAFPSQCGKTNLAMLRPTVPGWEVTCVGDDIAWMKENEDGYVHAINPEAGFFGVAPGTSDKTNPAAMSALTHDCIFTNVALTPEGDVWWEGMTDQVPHKLVDWTGEYWTPNCGRKAAHPNSRYTCPARNCNIMDEDWEAPSGVPISAILFGGRRASVVPLVQEAETWQQGVFMGSCCSSEQTAAAEGKVGELRIDPMAMLPFCGYNMGDYFRHWLNMGRKLGDKAPKLFFVNWFHKDENGKFLWPGFGDNIRVLKWIMQRVDKEVDAEKSLQGLLPRLEDIDIEGLSIGREGVKELLAVDADGLRNDVKSFAAFQQKIGPRLPEELVQERIDLENKLEM
mmetsp:Transcript_5699/g.16961  ORF Transcript_5699/g.16961 Transcript_5699/m.16961 type:complete len:603 (+) Transcript_5699:66-1874(+)|eukprot:CAMPEP_0198731034 /NCGR_PEP_ID=MMETSP1475-20131203/27707_1 /TAXON_ID= ORGANISM="Unidentified sp., Strain CCMP1999" /NCGR_SAMPLE_ID=MMETSP1475 /ASSEMBLY_ACC=CAM_ASM_001111 /LENGTH=602 /DNA_ID=CAMNT_0044493935 /DNA_START=28 /DNA_END=1836 /DNA_ORIENTATION=-